MFVVSVEFEVDNAHLAAFRRTVLEQAKNSLDLEEDCHTFHVCVDGDGEHGNRFFLYEEYTDRTAFDAHLASGHFRDFSALVDPWVVSKQVSTWYRL